MTNERIDVLAVMDKSTNLLELDGNPHTSRELEQAIAAVAELIEAAKVFVVKYDNAPDGQLGVGLVNGDFDRLRASLARVGGASV